MSNIIAITIYWHNKESIKNGKLTQKNIESQGWKLIENFSGILESRLIYDK